MTLDVVGWSGHLVANGAGIKTPLLMERSTGRYTSATNPSAWHDEKEIVASSRRGLLTLRDLHVPYIDGGVVIYAGYEFVDPKGNDRLLLDPGELVLHSVADSLVWVGHTPLGHALGVLQSWGRSLIDDAKCQLQKRSDLEDRRFAATRAMDDTRRARFCIAREDTNLRYEMFKTMAAAAWILQESLEPILMDASIDLGERGAANLARDARVFARQALAESAQPTDRPLPSFGRRGLHVYTNGTDTVVADDLADAQRVIEEQYGTTFAAEGWTLDDLDQVLDDTPLTICNIDDRGPDRKETRTAAAWAATHGRGFLCSTEY